VSRVLVVDDEPAIGWSLREILGDLGHDVQLAASAEAARESCRGFQPECILLDVRLPGEDGLTALPRLRELAGNVPVVVMTAFGDLNTAVRAVDAGAFEYLIKPFDMARVSEVVTRAIQEPAEQNGPPPADTTAASAAAVLIGTSPAMQQVFKEIALAATSVIPVLLTGETGTGKDLAARLIHTHGPRRTGPFLAANLGGLAPGVLESELFGHIKGGFTGAADDRAGLFAAAEGGSSRTGKSSRWAPRSRSRSTCESSPRATAISQPRLRQAVFAKISITGSPAFRSTCHRWPNGSRTCPPSWSTLPHTPKVAPPPASAPRFSRPVLPATGRATSASSSEQWNMPSSYRVAASCGPSICLPRR
jgi:FixJ family two-component response regulator